MLEKIGPTTKSTLSRSSRPLALVTAPSGLSSSSATTTSTSLPPILPPRSLTARAKPSRTCAPRAAAGPDRGHDHADLDLLLGGGRAGRDTEQDCKPGQFQLLRHDFPLR